MTTVAKGRWTSAPAPCEKAIGTNPRLATSPVMRIGRSRAIEARARPGKGEGAERRLRGARPRRAALAAPLDERGDRGDEHRAVEHGDARQRDDPAPRRDAEIQPPQPERQHPADRPERDRQED